MVSIENPGRPNTFCIQDKRGALALQLACRNGSASDVIKLLADTWPKSVQIETIHGFLPLYCAFQGNLSLKAIQLLVQA